MEITPTNKTPGISYNKKSNTLLIIGRCVPENPAAFFEPVIQLVKKALRKKGGISLIVGMQYFNTSSAGIMLRMFKTLSDQAKEGKQCHITWYFETDDVDIQEAGEDYRNIIGENIFSVKEVETFETLLP